MRKVRKLQGADPAPVLEFTAAIAGGLLALAWVTSAAGSELSWADMWRLASEAWRMVFSR